MDVGGEVGNVKQLYPFVNISETPLPSCWNPKDKFPPITLTNANTRARIRGRGVQVPAAVRSDHPIPASCGVYYFEVRIVDKGRQGCISVGICPGYARLDHMPGWCDGTFGYYGESGKIYAGSETGVAYGPSFTTGDVIGCGVNLVENTCFYTKNGQNIGTAFRNLEGKYYAAVGMVTSGETVEANFGQHPFIYNIYEDMKEIKRRVQASILRRALPPSKAEWFRSLIFDYLLHHGFCDTAESFNAHVQCSEKARKRQGVLNLIKLGNFDEAVQQISQLYPGLFDRRPVLLLTLQCLDFLSIVFSDDYQGYVFCQNDSKAALPGEDGSVCSSVGSAAKPRQITLKSSSCSPKRQKRQRPFRRSLSPVLNSVQNGCDYLKSSSLEYFDPPTSIENGTKPPAGCESGINEPADDVTSDSRDNGCVEDGIANGSGVFYDAYSSIEDGADGEVQAKNGNCLTVDVSCPNGNCADALADGEESRNEQLIGHGRELYQLCMQLKEQKRGDNALLKKCRRMLHDAFGAMACLPTCVTSGASHLDKRQRENILLALNSAMLESEHYSSTSALETVYTHAQRVRVEMASHGMGASAFANPDHLLN